MVKLPGETAESVQRMFPGVPKENIITGLDGSVSVNVNGLPDNVGKVLDDYSAALRSRDAPRHRNRLRKCDIISMKIKIRV